MAVPQKLQHRIMVRSRNSISGHILKRTKGKDPCSYQHYSQQPKSGSKLNVHGQMNKQNMVRIDNGCYSLKKKERERSSHCGIKGSQCLWSTRMQIQSPAWRSGLRIQRCPCCSVGHSCDLDLILGLGTLYAMGRPKEK